MKTNDELLNTFRELKGETLKNTPFEIGDTILLLNEIGAIGPIHQAGSNYVYLPVYLKSGTQVMITIRAQNEDEKAETSSSPHRAAFMKRFDYERNELIQAWRRLML